MNEPEKPKNLYTKLAEVVAETGYVEKKGVNTFSNYKYATEADITAAVRLEMAKRHIVMYPNIIAWRRAPKGEKGYFSELDILWTFSDAESGDALRITVPGLAMDSGDKDLYKAITGSQKYALKTLFMIPTGDDPEADNELEKEKPKEKPAAVAQSLPGDGRAPDGVMIGTLSGVTQIGEYTNAWLNGERVGTKVAKISAEMKRLDNQEVFCKVVQYINPYTKRKNLYVEHIEKNEGDAHEG